MQNSWFVYWYPYPFISFIDISLSYSIPLYYFMQNWTSWTENIPLNWLLCFVYGIYGFVHGHIFSNICYLCSLGFQRDFQDIFLLYFSWNVILNGSKLSFLFQNLLSFKTAIWSMVPVVPISRKTEQIRKISAHPKIYPQSYYNFGLIDREICLNIRIFFSIFPQRNMKWKREVKWIPWNDNFLLFVWMVVNNTQSIQNFQNVCSVKYSNSVSNIRKLTDIALLYRRTSSNHFVTGIICK